MSSRWTLMPRPDTGLQAVYLVTHAANRTRASRVTGMATAGRLLSRTAARSPRTSTQLFVSLNEDLRQVMILPLP